MDSHAVGSMKYLRRNRKRGERKKGRHKVKILDLVIKFNYPITEDLIRKRSEHNECVISTLEELSLHQQDIEKIEFLDQWCRDLKILYLQSNLIPRIENVGRLKKLEYLNLALNNVEKVENLEGCESLTKLDLTVNFVAELTSLESLMSLCHLKDLFLTGNPCAEYDGYRDFVIATLPQLKFLDGVEIEKSERIRATQKLHELRPEILRQQKKYLVKRAKEKAEAENTEDTPIISSDASGENSVLDEEAEQRYWKEPVAYTPESRVNVHKHMEQAKYQRENRGKPAATEKKERRLQMEDGRILNINEPKVDFSLTEDAEGKNILLDVAVFRFMDTELCDADVQPTYVQVLIKGKMLQIALPEEVHPLQSTAQRSQITGHLLITMPKVKPVLKAVHTNTSKKLTKPTDESKNITNERKSREVLEVDPSSARCVDFANIVSDSTSAEVKRRNLESGAVGNSLLTTKPQGMLRAMPVERKNSDSFVDDPDVPPLF